MERELTFSKGWSTHMPMLIKTVQATKGPVLEIGCGLYSTPLLHWLCAESRRTLVTFENDDKYFKWAKRYQSKTHRIRTNIDGLENEKWSVVFIDCSTKERPIFLDRFKDSAEFLVIHDTNEDQYGYDDFYSHFEYRYDWKFCVPWTTVLSNVKDINK